MVEGSLGNSLTTDADVRSPYQSRDIILVLSGDTFLPSVGYPPASDALLTALQSEGEGDGSLPIPLGGWADAVRPLLTRHDILPLNRSAVRVRIPAAPR